jgi:signal peptide peptidase SppA
MADHKYPNVIRAVSETPWAILPSKLAAIVDLISLRASGQQLTEEEIQARIGAGPAHKQTSQQGVVAVLPLYGVIAPKADAMTEISGGTSVQTFAADFRSVLNDDQVKAIVLDVDSPGGQTDLLPELAAEIRAGRGSKPIVAVANTMAASAAFWIASQADELVVTPSGSVGSVGVFAAHDDISALQEQLGVKTTLISAGKDKTLGNPFEPLSDEARQMIQERVDEAYDMFTSDVAKGRGVSQAQVKNGYGEGRMVTAQTAVSEGMADRVGTLEQTIARVANPNGRSRNADGDVGPANLTACSQGIGVLNGGRTGTTIPDSDRQGVYDHLAKHLSDAGREPPALAQAETDLQAAASGLSFADSADEALRAIDAVVTRTEALRVLTGPKREQLTSLVERCQQLLASHDPAKFIDDDLAFEAERVFAESRFNTLEEGEHRDAS